MLAETELAYLIEGIKKNVILERKQGATIVAGNGEHLEWNFNFRPMLLDAEYLNIVAELFWEMCGHKYPFQIGGLETASIPLITALIIKGRERGTPINGFYIRKSRKPTGLQKIIEGNLTDDPVILVDDLIRDGNTFLRQIKVLEVEQKKIIALFSIVRFRNTEEYVFAKEYGIEIITPLTLADFGFSMGLPTPLPDYNAFSMKWGVRIPNPNYFYRVQKSTPVLDTTKVYFGSDDGVMRAFLQTTGEEVWNFKMLGLGSRGKTIFSSPAIFNNTLYFGAYDGNFYALDTQTGEKKWIYMDADWIGSSPCIAEDLDLVYIGLEYGLFNKKGGIVALNLNTGEKKWEYIEMPKYTHGSPAYSKKFNAVAVGSNDGSMYMFRASDGALLWKLETGGEIKAAPAFDEQRGYVTFGSYDGVVYIVRIQDGSVIHATQTTGPIESTPLVSTNRLYISGLDKFVYCLNLNTFAIDWKFETGGRIFASPVLINEKVYVGSNDGRLYELDENTGKNSAFFQTTERITNKITYNQETGCFFVLTYANELYCVERKSPVDLIK